MNRRILVTTATVAAAAVLAGASFALSSAPSHVKHSGHSGLTAHGIQQAARSGGLHSNTVTMSPQSSLALIKQATKLRAHAPSAKIKIVIGLKLHNVAKLKAFLRNAQIKGNPAYHQWLTPEQFTAMYGPTAADVARVVAFLKASGITVTKVAPNRMLIQTEAPTKFYNHAFGIEINDYKLNGRVFYSTTDSPKLPRAIAPLVANVLGLNHGMQMRPHSHWQPLMSARDDLGPQAVAPPASLTDLNPLQIAKAYNYPDITDASHGAGVTVAILTALSPGLDGLSDPHDFWAAFGLPDHTINVIAVGGDSGSGGMGETLLDIEYSGAMGPGITQNVYVAADASFATFNVMYNQFAVDNTADVMTTSWGAAESVGDPDYYTTTEQIFMQAAAQGIPMFAASGDHGSDDADGTGNMADYPSSSVYITAANGTQLTISDLSGTWGSEVVWNDADCFGGPASTGGAISMYFDKPTWQFGPGVPTDVDMRMNSGIALTASCSRPMLVLQGGTWFITGGTSAVAPQLAGLFSIATAENGDRLGQGNSLIYEDARNHYATDFHDITEGNNGAYAATPDWDHPSGWGSVNAQNLLSHLGIQGPKGTLAGTVTDSSGVPIPHANLEITQGGVSFSFGTEEDGTYSITLAVGDYTVTATEFGYVAQSASVSIVDGQTTTQDFALAAAPSATLSGTVTDGSGHGYALYALIQIDADGFGPVAAIWNNPGTGAYSVDLPTGNNYTMVTAAGLDGYTPDTRTFTLSADQTEDVALTVTAACTAPGYGFAGLTQDFNGAFPPAGWTVTNDLAGAVVVWESTGTLGEDNVTGGTGNAADADSDHAGFGSGPFDTSLISPPISLSGGSVLKYKANYRNLSGDSDPFDLDISTDGGATWTNILHWTSDHGGLRSLPGEDVTVDLSPYLPTSGDYQLRWRYYDLTGGWVWYAMIDDVAIGGCQPIPGGLVGGQVTDANTGEGILGATVTADTGQSGISLENPADPNLPVGTYGFFVPAGERTLTASDEGYSDATAQVSVANNAIVHQDFVLKSSKFEANPDAFELHVMVNNSATAAFALANSGMGTGLFKILAIDSPPPPKAAITGPFAVTPRYRAGTDLAALMAPGARPHATSGRVRPHDDMAPHAAGDLVGSFPAGIAIYGLGADHAANDLWLGSPAYGGLGGDDVDHRFLLDGTNTGDGIDVASPDVLYMADMAFDANTGMLWQATIDQPDGSTGHIIELDPNTLQATGNSILIPAPQSERGLAYDPLSDTWYAGDFNSETIYHFDASGTLLDSANVALPITGLTYNPITGHLFVLTSVGEHAIYVLDAKNNYAQLSFFDVEGFDQSNSGAGLGNTCDGKLVISDYINKTVYLAESGELAWCVAGISWLTVAPTQGTVAAGASTQIALTFDGTDQERFTTSEAYLAVQNNSPYGALIVPLTVTWDPQPVDLVITGAASPDPLQKGGNLTYTLTVQNQTADNHGSATETTMTYALPAGVSYIASNGDASCTAPPAGTSAPAMGTVTCAFGTVDLGASKAETIAVQVADAGTLNGTFTVTAREPDSDPDTNTVSLDTTVTGVADVSVSAGNATIPVGTFGTIHIDVGNAGPDTATDVQLKISSGSSLTLSGATSTQGSCATSGNSLIICDLGDVAIDSAGGVTTSATAGGVGVDVSAFGAYAGSATLTVQLLTSSDDPNPGDNNVATPTITVSSGGDGGGGSGSGGGGSGALGWLALAALLGLGLTAGYARRSRRQGR